jgi:NitT/TauT family transport system substrate-binding protein
MYGYNYYATDSYIRGNPEVMAKFGRAITKAIIFAKTNLEATVRIFWRQFPAAGPADPNDQAALARDMASLRGQLADMNAFSRKLSYPWGYQDRRKWETMQQYMLRGEQITRAVPATSLFMRPRIKQWHNFDKQRIVNRARNWR